MASSNDPSVVEKVTRRSSPSSASEIITSTDAPPSAEVRTVSGTVTNRTMSSTVTGRKVTLVCDLKRGATSSISANTRASPGRLGATSVTAASPLSSVGSLRLSAVDSVPARSEPAVVVNRIVGIRSVTSATCARSRTFENPSAGAIESPSTESVNSRSTGIDSSDVSTYRSASWHRLRMRAASTAAARAPPQRPGRHRERVIPSIPPSGSRTGLPVP